VAGQPEGPLPAGPPPEVAAVAAAARSRGLCDDCFGRLIGGWGHGLTNRERAALLDSTLAEPRAARDGECPLCRGLFGHLDRWVDRVVAAGAGAEWSTFACGSRWDPGLLAAEELLWSEVGTAWGESAHAAFNRELGKLVEARTGAVGAPDRPEIVFVADLPLGHVEVTVQPLYVMGRYRKLDRELPQTRWPCRRCRGRGCDRCGGTGKTYAESVEELVAAPFVAATRATGTRFHGMGREDRDARMLGDGRPFVLELLQPEKRRVDVGALAQSVASSSGGRVEVLEATPATAADVVRVKEAAPEKSYRVEVAGAVPGEKVNEALRLATARAIAQRTPTRVAHRRADRVRTRRIVAATLVAEGPEGFTLEVRAEAGTYIKEWVDGDAGRTEPSLADLVGTPLSVRALDVLEIHDR